MRCLMDGWHRAGAVDRVLVSSINWTPAQIISHAWQSLRGPLTNAKWTDFIFLLSSDLGSDADWSECRRSAALLFEKSEFMSCLPFSSIPESRTKNKDEVGPRHQPSGVYPELRTENNRTSICSVHVPLPIFFSCHFCPIFFSLILLKWQRLIIVSLNINLDLWTVDRNINEWVVQSTILWPSFAAENFE